MKLKRLLLALAVVSGLAVGAVPVADAAPPVGRCSRQELVGVRGGTEGIGASDVVAGGGSIHVEADGSRWFNLGIELADEACSGITYRYTATSADGLHTYTDVVVGQTSDRFVTLESHQPIDSSISTLHVVVTTSSAVNDEIDRAPDTGSNDMTDGAGGGQSYH